MACIDGEQPGDPARASAAIVAAVMAETPYFRLPLGRDAIERMETKLRQVFLTLVKLTSSIEDHIANACRRPLHVREVQTCPGNAIGCGPKMRQPEFGYSPQPEQSEGLWF